MTASPGNAPSLEINAVSLSHDGHAVLDNLNLSLAAGRWHLLLGRSGVGKSSLLHLIAGLTTADSGQVRGGDGATLDGRVAVMFQDDALLPWLTVRDNVCLGARLRGQTSSSDRERADELIDKVGLGDWKQHRPGALSGGMRQRVALARTLFEARPLVLMDEPFSRLDALTRAELYQLAISLLDEHTVIMVTHDPIEALRLADQVTVMQGGKPTLTHSYTPPGQPPRHAEQADFGAAYADLWSLLSSPSPGSNTA